MVWLPGIDRRPPDWPVFLAGIRLSVLPQPSRRFRFVGFFFFDREGIRRTGTALKCRIIIP